jgi:hypothetical protein
LYVLFGVRYNLSAFGGGIEKLLSCQPGDVIGGDVGAAEVGLVLFWVVGEVQRMG